MTSPAMAPAQVETMPLAEAMPTEEPRIGIGARVGNMVSRVGDAITNGYEALQEVPLAYKVAVGSVLATLAISGHAEAATIDADSIALGGNVPGLQGEQTLPDGPAIPWAIEKHPFGAQVAEGNIPTATASSMSQYCSKVLSRHFPQVLKMSPKSDSHELKTGIIEPGKYRQTFGVLLEAQAADPTCIDAGYHLKGVARAVVAQPDNHKDLYGVGIVLYNDNAGKRQGAFPNIASFVEDNYRCTPGPEKTPAYVQLDDKVFSPGGQKIADRREQVKVPVLDGSAGHLHNAAC